MQRQCGFVTRPDCRLYFEAMGEGPALVFAHGLGGSHLSWWQQMPHFAERNRCVAFAHRGFGPSTAPAEGADPRQFADDLAALADHLALGPLTIVAQSMGGWTAIEFALRFPDRVRGIVLSSTSGTIDYTKLSPALTEPLARWNREAAEEIERCTRLGLHVAAGARMAEEQPAHHLLYQEVDETSAGLDKMLVRDRLLSMRVRPASTLRAISAPVLVVVGEEDIVFPACVGDALAGSFARGRAVAFRQCGHSPYFERPQAFNTTVEGFIATL
jgi:3-oxoadipate enol-lactonase